MMAALLGRASAGAARVVDDRALLELGRDVAAGADGVVQAPAGSLDGHDPAAADQHRAVAPARYLGGGHGEGGRAGRDHLGADGQQPPGPVD